MGRVVDTVLFAVVGQLGQGKTLTLSYLAWSNWYRKGRKIYANYDLFGIPFTRIKSIPDLDKMKQGFFAADELWLWVDAWASRSAKANVISSILLKSRKREITIAYTSQSMQQINNRVRNITDFVAYPMMAPDNKYTRVTIFKGGGNITFSSEVKPPLYFNNLPMFALYNTCEEVSLIEEGKTDEEHFFHVYENVAFVRYLRAQELDDKQIKKVCDDVEKVINPDGIKSEAERQKAEDMDPVRGLQ